MNGKKYEIKSLEWVQSGSESFNANIRDGYVVYESVAQWQAVYDPSNPEIIDDGFDSSELAKQACERHHLQYMEELLTEVKE